MRYQMQMRHPASVVLVAAVAIAGSARIDGQTPSPKPAVKPAGAGTTPAKSAETPKRGWTAPRTPWGDPDIEGLWPGTDFVGVPLQRPDGLGTRNELTDAEFAVRLQNFQKQSDEDNADFDID